jgi:hypothetical protein
MPTLARKRHRPQIHLFFFKKKGALGAIKALLRRY